MTKDHTKGPVVLIGGAEDKTDRKEILRRTVELNSAKKAVLIPTASDYPTEAFETYRRTFRSLGVHDLKLLDIRYRYEADKPEHLEAVSKADLIFFSGGDQEKLVNVLDTTLLLQEIFIRHAQGVTVAGTSAGASALGHPIIFEGDGNRGFKKRHVLKMKGFGFLDGIVVDTHFMERGRIPRLTQITASGQTRMGVGLGENTGAVVTPDGCAEIIGEGVAVFLNGRDIVYTNYDRAGQNERIAADGIRFSFLTAGMIYDLEAGGMKTDGGLT